MPCGSVCFEIKNVPELEMLGFLVALIPKMASRGIGSCVLRREGGMPAPRPGCGRVPAREQAGTGGAAVGPLPGAGLSAGRAERVSASSLPCCPCPAGGQGLGLVIVAGWFMVASIPQPARLGRGERRLRQGSRRSAGWRIQSCGKKPSISKPVASSFGHADKVLTQQRRGARMFSCLRNLESLRRDFP